MTEVLTKINEGEVVSNDGYRVRYGREHLTYMEAERYLTVPIEHLMKPYEMLIYAGSLDRWQFGGQDAKPISLSEREIVLRRIQNVLRFLGRPFSIKWTAEH
jgi:hypothetical protein